MVKGAALRGGAVKIACRVSNQGTLWTEAVATLSEAVEAIQDSLYSTWTQLENSSSLSRIKPADGHFPSAPPENLYSVRL